MIERMFFYDGKLSDIKIDGAYYLDAADGYTRNMSQIRSVRAMEKVTDVVTNQIAVLDSHWCWNKKTHMPAIYLMDKDTGTWKNVQMFYEDTIVPGTHIEILYRHGKLRCVKRESNGKVMKEFKQIVLKGVDGG